LLQLLPLLQDLLIVSELQVAAVWQSGSKLRFLHIFTPKCSLWAVNFSDKPAMKISSNQGQPNLQIRLEVAKRNRSAETHTASLQVFFLLPLRGNISTAMW
jgi:hypothetical protein